MVDPYSDSAEMNYSSLDANASEPTEDTEEQFCGYDFGADLFTRFLYVGVFQMILCCVGIAGNLSVIVTLSRKQMRSSSGWFLVVLAVADSMVMLTTILLYCFEVIYDYTRNLLLYLAWFSYVRACYALSHLCQISAVYLTIGATVERCMSLWSDRWSQKLCKGPRTFFWVAVVLMCTVPLTVVKFWELGVVVFDACPGFGRYQLEQGHLLGDTTYQLVYTLWISNAFFIFLPFVALSLLNILIWWKMRQSTNNIIDDELIVHSPLARHFHRKARRRNWEATVVLFVVVLVFLVCNAPQLILTIVEQYEDGLKFLNDHAEFYSYCRDAINFLTVVNSSSNFLIYLIFGREFRRVLFGSLKRRFLESAWATAMGGFGIANGKVNGTLQHSTDTTSSHEYCADVKVSDSQRQPSNGCGSAEIVDSKTESDSEACTNYYEFAANGSITKHSYYYLNGATITL